MVWFSKFYQIWFRGLVLPSLTLLAGCATGHDYTAIGRADQAIRSRDVAPAYEYSETLESDGEKMASPDSESAHDDHKMMNHAPTNAKVYLCPMHPEQKSNRPGKCPICGMQLQLKDAEPAPETEVEHEHSH